MFERFAQSWELVKASWRVLQSDKELLIFPLISAIGAVGVSILFALPFFAVGIQETGRRGGEDMPLTLAGYVILFLFYVALYTVIFFCNTALVGAALIRLRGGDPTVSDGFNIAMKKIGHILGYAVISATVGVILDAISRRGGIVGQIASGIIGFAWNVATFLVVPVLVNEDIGPIDAVKKSAALLKKTWGDQVVGNLGMGLIFGVISLVLLGVFIALMALFIGMEATALIILTVVVFIAAFVILGLISSALQGIYQAAVYQYALEGETSEYFDPQLVAGAFKPKRG
jgi:hypothetical protein